MDQRRALHAPTTILQQALGMGTASTHILTRLRSKEPATVRVALEDLSTILLMSLDDSMLGFPIADAIKELVRILALPNPFADIPVLAARVITQIIDRGEAALEVLMENGILNALHARFQDLAYVDIVEQAIVILDRVALHTPRQALESGCPLICLQYVDFFNLHIQRSILTIVSRCCSAVDSTNIAFLRPIVPLLEEHVTGCAQSLIDLSIKGLCLVIEAISSGMGDPREETRALFNEKTARVIASRIAPDDPLLTRALRATTCLAQILPQVVLESINNHVPLATAHAITGVPDITDRTSFDSNSAATKLIYCPKDALTASIQLLGALMPHRNYDTALLVDVPLVALEQLAATVVELGALVHSSSTDLMLRQQALGNVIAFARGTPKKIIKSVANKLDIVAFVCAVVSHADTVDLGVGGLEVCAELTEKLPEMFSEAFYRRGIAPDLDAIIADEDATPKAHQLARKIKKALGPWIQETPTPGNHALDLLKRGDASAWPEVSNILGERTIFELLRVGAFDTIADAVLADPDSFIRVFDAIKFRELVLKLGDAMSRTERCSVLYAGKDQCLSLQSALRRQIRIRVKDKDRRTSWSINVQGIATVKNLETFCKEKISLFQFVRGNNQFEALNRQVEGASESDSAEYEDYDGEEHDDGEPGHREPRHGNMEAEPDDDDTAPGYLDDPFGNPWGNHMALAAESSLEDPEMEIEPEAQEATSLNDDDDDSQASGEEPIEIDHAPLNNIRDPLFNRAFGALRRSQTAEFERPNLRFYYNDTPIHPEMSVLGAIYNPIACEGDAIIPESFWTEEFTVSFERIDRPAETQGAIRGATKNVDTSRELPKSLGVNQQLRSVIRLLSILHGLNEKHQIVSSHEFVNMKLTSKLNRQLEDPFVVIASVVPQWTYDTVRLYPFLYPLGTRQLFVRCTSFGYSRSLDRWEGRDGHRYSEMLHMGMGRVLKQKYRISRKSILSNGLKVLKMTSKMIAAIEIEYYGEQGTGLGPTLEFFSSLSREFQRFDLDMWRGMQIEGYFFDPQGLFPAPMDTRNNKVVNMFTGLGRFFARALLDERLMDIPINPAFFVLVLGHEFINPQGLLGLVDPDLAKHLFTLEKQSVEELGLDFTLPGYDIINLLPGGCDQLVTGARLQEYQDLVVSWTVGQGVERQIEAFKAGFSETMPVETLKAFLPGDFHAICGQNQESWDVATLRNSIKAEHGFNMESPSVKHLFELMAGFSCEERRRFLRFMTGSSNLPVGGFKQLRPTFTVVLKQIDDPNLGPDDYFPSVMTCANYLKIPAYSSREVMSRKLWEAIDGGSEHFPLS